MKNSDMPAMPVMNGDNELADFSLEHKMTIKNTGDKAMELSFPIMITLREIRDNSPCKDGWTKVLTANGGASADMNKPFEMASIIDSNGLNDCLWALRCKPEYQHIYRRFAVICADEVAHLFCDDRSVAALDVAWRHSCGEASDDELAAARDAAWDAARAAAWDTARDAARDAALSTAMSTALSAARAAAQDAARAAARDAARDTARDAALSRALSAARAAARDAARDAAWDTALSAAQDAALSTARDAALSTALSTARDAAWDTDRDAALAAARDAALSTARDAAWEYQSITLRNALTTGEVVRKCQKP